MVVIQCVSSHFATHKNCFRLRVGLLDVQKRLHGWNDHYSFKCIGPFQKISILPPQRKWQVEQGNLKICLPLGWHKFPLCERHGSFLEQPIKSPDTIGKYWVTYLVVQFSDEIIVINWLWSANCGNFAVFTSIILICCLLKLLILFCFVIALHMSCNAFWEMFLCKFLLFLFAL